MSDYEEMDEEERPRENSFLEILGLAVTYWRRRPWLTTGSFGLMMLATVTETLSPWAAGRLIDLLAAGEASGVRDDDRAFGALMVILGIAASFYLMRNIGFRLWVLLAARNMSSLVQDSFRKVQSFSSDWHANSFAGATVRKITRGMWAYDTVSDAFFLGIIPSVLVIIGLTAQIAWRWPVVGGAMFAVSIVFVIASMLVSLKYVSPANKEQNAADSKMGGAIADALTCNAVVKAFGAEAREESRFAEIVTWWRAKAERAWPRFMDMILVQNVILLTMQAVLLGLVIRQWGVGQATAGDVTFVLTSFFIIAGYLRQLGETLQQLQRGVNELDDLVTFAKETAGVRDEASAPAFAPGRGEIAFDNVTFGYRGAAGALYQNFSLTIQPGERIGLVGPSGSGKSTFVKLVQRLYDVDGGRILIDGQDISHIAQASLRASIALVPQDPALFHRSLAENISYARPDATMEEIIEAAKRARAHDFIARLPQGYDTLVGERGVKLSGGERQRVAIARAFLADAQILVLDEATSSLDSITEAEIQAAIEELMRGRTAILIAHRLSTVRHADRILVFDSGRIVEEGRHDELITRENGRYRALHLIQGAA